jgi:NAD-dependent deacetylase
MSFDINPEVVQRLRTASHVAVLTGSGVASECGVPSAKDSLTGPWAEYDRSELATQQGFLRNPRLVWEWYAHRRAVIDQLEPGASHYALVDLEQYFQDFLLITQSVDGLHWRAGSRDLLELHGNIARTRCFECGGYAQGWDEDGSIPPVCAHCGGMLRPDVVWLGEGIPSHGLRRAYEAAERAQVFLSIGASARVQPASSLPMIAKRAGAFVVEINPEETALALMADCWMPYKAEAILPVLVKELLGDTLMAREEGM